MLTLSVFSKLFLLPLLISILCSANQNINPCRRKWFPDAESFVCVCDDEFCDEPEPTGSPEEDELLLFSSDRQKHRLHRSSIRFSNTSRTEYDDAASASSSSALIIVNGSVQFQSLLGFGGAFSNSVGLNLNALNWSARERLLRAYFDLETGIGYRLGRVPIASTDFSTREYSYLDKERDFDMESFSLAPEDLELKIPYIQMANKMSGNRLQLFAAPWASPAWMKSNGRMSGAGQLKGDLDGPYYRTYAHYLKRFFDEYLAHGIHFWALTLQNQPESGLEEIPFQSMFLSNHTQREFATRLLVPLLRQSPHTAGLQLIAFDDVREHLVSSVREIFAKQSATPSKGLIGKFLCPLFAKMPASILPAFAFNFVSNLIGCRGAEVSPEGADLISGIGIHWYTLDGHEGQSEVHGMLPDKFILGTEACAGFLPEDAGPRLGNWTRGWMYGHDILQNLRNWAAGWVDWNLCLNEQGGPNWANNFVDAPIIVSAEKGEFYKQPMFYWLAHFSRFIPPGSVHIESSSFFNQEEEENPSIEHVAFVTPEGNKVLVLINPPAAGAANLQRIRIRDAQSGREAELSVEAESIMTVIWK